MSPEDRPVVAWIGPEPPAALRGALDALVELHEGWTPRAVLAVVAAELGLEALDGRPEDCAGVPVVAVAPTAPDVHRRLAWIDAGADDLVAEDSLPAAIRLRLDGTDPFPPVPVEEADARAVEEARRWVERLQEYLMRRHEFARQHGQDALVAFDGLCRVRDGVPVGMPPAERRGAFGLPAAGPDAPGWPAVVRRATPGGGIEGAPARVIGVGADGLLLEVGFRARPRQRLVCDLAVGARANAQLMLEARLMRRAGVDRFHLGGRVLEIRRRRW